MLLCAMILGPLAKQAKEGIKQGNAMQRSGDPLERYLGALHSGEGGDSFRWTVYPIDFFLSEQGIGAAEPGEGYGRGAAARTGCSRLRFGADGLLPRDSRIPHQARSRDQATRTGPNAECAACHREVDAPAIEGGGRPDGGLRDLRRALTNGLLFAPLSAVQAMPVSTFLAHSECSLRG